jgi:methionine-rich copper-binding protein CopC
MARATGLLVAILVVALAVVGPALITPPAMAHAELTRALQAAGASLVQSPLSIRLTFSEAVDPTVSSIELYGSDGRRVGGVEKPTTAPGGAPALQARLTTVLTDGLYTVEWRTISVDGHAVAGAYSFGVRQTPASAQARSLTGTTKGQAAASIAGRWLVYVGLVLLVGAALTGWIALGGRITEPGQWLLRGAWLLTAAGILTSMLAERAITKVPSLLPLFLTPEGVALANEGKAIVACGAAVLVISLPASDSGGSPHTQADDVEVGGQRGREALDRLRNVVAAWNLPGAQQAPRKVSRSCGGGCSSR